MKRGGFTLLELLASVTVFTLLALLLFTVVEGATRLWRENEKRVDSYREARAAVELVARELAAAYRGHGNGTADFRVADAASGPLVAGDLKPDSSKVFFLASLPPRAQAPGELSDICAVGYYLAFTSDPNTQTAGSYKLFRYFTGSNATFEAVANSTLYSGAGPAATARNEVLARNIQSFRVTAYNTANATLQPANGTLTALPDLVEVSVAAFNTETAAKLRARSDWEAPPAGIGTEARQEFTVRVSLK